jgi:addiction module HigA family antidote
VIIWIILITITWSIRQNIFTGADCHGVLSLEAKQWTKNEPRKINEIVQGKRSVTADAALRLARFFGTSAEVWIKLQAHYDLAEQVAQEVTPYPRPEQDAALLEMA